MRTSDGCWTCRIRRKKCNLRRPVCDVCAALKITCHFGEDKPHWMDGGPRQEEMAELIRREVRQQAQRRSKKHLMNAFGSDVTSVSEHNVDVLLQGLSTTGVSGAPSGDALEGSQIALNGWLDTSKAELSARQCERGPAPSILAAISPTFRRQDTFLGMFYLENVLPFLFPFYKPPMNRGSTAWVLEMMMTSPVVRQATLCQASHFFTLANGSDPDKNWNCVLAQTRDAFEVLGQALKVVQGSDIRQHMHGTARILASIMQLLRFEVAILSFDNCQAHLNAALALFRQLLDNCSSDGESSLRAVFDTVWDRLGPSDAIHAVDVPRPEQMAFQFSTSLLIYDDIIASTIHQEAPRLSDIHPSILGKVDDRNPLIDLEAVVGCQNWVLQRIGETSALDGWKRKSQKAGNLDVMEVVRQATSIKGSLETNLKRLESGTGRPHAAQSDLRSILEMGSDQKTVASNEQSSVVTRVWAHAALIYLSIVVSGWQPKSDEVRYHVHGVLDLIKNHTSPPSLLRTMVWPFCVAGCLAQQCQEGLIRDIVQQLRPPSLFGTVQKAVEVMEHAWRRRDADDLMEQDLATYLKSCGDLVLLV